MKWLSACWKQLWITLVVALVMVALYTSLGRTLVPLIENWRPDLEQQLSEVLGQPVQVQSLEGDWRFLFPIVRVRQLHIGTDAIKLSRIEVELDPTMSLYHRLPVFRRIEVDGVSGYFRRSESGWVAGEDWQLTHSEDPQTGTEPVAEAAAEPEPAEAVEDSTERPVWLRLLELQQTMRVSNWHILVESHPGKVDQLRIEELLWRHQGDSQSITGDISLGRKQLATTRVSALLHGQLWPWSKQSGKVFLDVEPQSWASWIPELPSSISLPKLNAGAAVWLRVEEGNLKDVYADIAVNDLELTSKENQLAVQQGRIQVAGKHHGRDWHLRVLPELGEVLPLDLLTVSSVDLRGRQGWHIGIPELRMGEARTLLVDHQVLPSRIHRYLKNLKPEGLAEDVRIAILKGDKLDVDLRAHASDVSMQTYLGIPGITNLEGEVHLSPSLGRFDFVDQKPVVNLSGVYDQHWKMDSVTGTFRWMVQPEASQIWLEGIQARSAGLELNSELTMYLPARTSPRETRIRLLLGVPKAHSEDKARLLPDLLEDGVRSWIDQAILNADLSAGAFMLDGVLEEDRPDNSLTTQLAMQFDQGRLRYLEGWPEMENLKGELLLDTPNLSLDLEAGKTLGGVFRRNSGKVRLTTGKDKVTWLTVSGRVRGTSTEAFQYFRETPLQQVVDGTFDHWYGAGRLDTSLWLKMPLVEEAVEPHVKLNSRLRDNKLAITDLNLVASEINGSLRFDSRKGLFSDGLSGQIFGDAFDARLDSSSEQGNIVIRMEGSGRAKWDDFREWMPLFLLEPLTGDLGYQADMSIDTGAGKLVFDLSSSLDGTRIDYPYPLGKTAEDDQHALNVRIEPGRETRIKLNYDQRIRAVFAMDDQGLNRGQVYLGDHEPFLGSDPGVDILGEVPETIRAEEWWAKWQELLPLAEAEQARAAQSVAQNVSGIASSSGTGAGSSASSDTATANPLRNVEITLADVMAWDLPARETRIKARHDLGDWIFEFESPLAKGTTLIHSDDSPVDIDLEYLHLPAAEDASSDSAHAEGGEVEGSEAVKPSDDEVLAAVLANDALKDMVPADLLPMNLNMAEFFVGGWNFGRWKMSSKPIENGIAVSILESDLKGLSFTGDFRWLQDDEGHKTAIDLLNIKGKDLARVQKSFRQDVILEGEKLTSAARLSWQGSPMAFNSQSLDGLVSLKVEKGTWKTEGAGALKAFGALNFRSISRRLQLDFSDLYQSGLAFDVMRAKARIEGGLLTFAEPLVVDGPGAKFLSSGSTNLNDGTLDMKFAVTFPVTDTLPLVAVLAGFAPQVAGAIYVTEKLIGDELEQFTSASYDVRGTWSKPDMKIRGAFDNEVDGKRVRSFKERFLSIFGLEESE